ncbi:MAG: hypothetical protein AYP45_04355, partial [Candidatus Brocadia carolinensis]
FPIFMSHSFPFVMKNRMAIVYFEFQIDYDLFLLVFLLNYNTYNKYLFKRPDSSDKIFHEKSPYT